MFAHNKRRLLHVVAKEELEFRSLLLFIAEKPDHSLAIEPIGRASIDLEPKIRTIGKNTIFLPKKNRTFFQKKILY